jgi:hypothetical protein
MHGLVLVRKACKGCLVQLAGSPARGIRPGESRSRLRDAGGTGPRDRSWESVWEESGREPGQGLGRETLGGRSPREHPAVGELNPVRSLGTPERVEARKPRPVGPAHRFGGGITDGRNGRRVHPRGNAADTFREEKAPKGESQERRRRETKPARARKE